jgi:hypothetical protein
MLRNIAVVAILGIAAFLVTYLLLGGFGDVRVADPDRAPRIPGRTDPGPVTPIGRPASGTPVGDESGDETADPDSAAAAKDDRPGTIAARVTDVDGAILRDFSLDLRPFMGEVTHHELGLLEIERVPPGKYVPLVVVLGQSEGMVSARYVHLFPDQRRALDAYLATPSGY